MSCMVCGRFLKWLLIDWDSKRSFVCYPSLGVPWGSCSCWTTEASTSCPWTALRWSFHNRNRPRWGPELVGSFHLFLQMENEIPCGFQAAIKTSQVLFVKLYLSQQDFQAFNRAWGAQSMFFFHWFSTWSLASDAQVAPIPPSDRLRIKQQVLSETGNHHPSSSRPTHKHQDVWLVKWTWYNQCQKIFGISIQTIMRLVMFGMVWWQYGCVWKHGTPISTGLLESIQHDKGHIHVVDPIYI